MSIPTTVDIHTTYGSQAYDPNFIYQISAQEQTKRIAEADLRYRLVEIPP